MACRGVAAAAVDLFEDDGRLGDAETRSSVLGWNERGEKPGLRQRTTERRPDTAESSLKVYGVSEELGFVVLYVKGVDWTKKGTRILLEPGGSHPPLEVKITEINRWGLAVAYIQGDAPRPLPIKGGDVVAVRPLL
jgi:hypothetical protein